MPSQTAEAFILLDLYGGREARPTQIGLPPRAARIESRQRATIVWGDQGRQPRSLWEPKQRARPQIRILKTNSCVR